MSEKLERLAKAHARYLAAYEKLRKHLEQHGETGPEYAKLLDEMFQAQDDFTKEASS